MEKNTIYSHIYPGNSRMSHCLDGHRCLRLFLPHSAVECLLAAEWPVFGNSIAKLPTADKGAVLLTLTWATQIRFECNMNKTRMGCGFPM